MIPWTMIAITSGAFAIVFIAHLASLFGIDTTQRPRF
jgi:hypothetical protein